MINIHFTSTKETAYTSPRTSLEPPPSLISLYLRSTNYNNIQLLMEITVVSAQGLKKSSSLFSHHIRPFITLTTSSSSSSHLIYKTTVVVDHQGGLSPTWGHNFDLSNVIDATFFSHNNSSYIYLHLYTNRLFLLGPRFLGWCRIPAADIADGFSPVRHLSYRLRKKDGSRGHGVVNVVVKLETTIFQALRRGDAAGVPEMNFGRVAMGIPVRTPQAVVADQGTVIVACHLPSPSF
ncbi:putative C2 domain-containing protein [Helianthus annuus]|nr:putative C2 domain-containing protein [Helianthus annuus]KAJ0634520.1 putative C2 domain-containing protein [Helianthus annuus]